MTQSWRPFTLAWNDAPIDLSFLYEKEKPAGRHGFLQARGDRFFFEDGAEGRFWGVNFNSGANFPPHAYSEMVARRLAKFGVNIVRTHQMDAEWATPNIFQFNRAKPKDNTRSLDPESMDRLDYLIYCLKQEGIYLYLDMLTYRQFLPGDGVDAVEQLPQAAKPYTYFDPRLIELQKEFNSQLWNHINPYTRLAYKDDPAIVLMELKNESDLFTQPPTLEPYRSRLEAMYRAWAAQHTCTVPAEKVDFAKPDGQIARFFYQVQVNYYREMVAHLRDIGVKVPINGTNWPMRLGVLASQLETDFTDSHWYWGFPFWEQAPGTTSIPMVSEARNIFATLAFERVLEKPFFISEWDQAWPDEWRAESPLPFAALAALQGWGGVIIHAYRYSTWTPQDRIGGGASTINGITYRNHFDTFNDPAKFGLFYHAALLYRRGDVREAEQTCGIRIADDGKGEWLLKRPEDIPALTALPEKHKMGMLLPGASGAADKEIDAAQDALSETGEVLSDTGELWRSWQKRYAWINTPRTQAAYGFLGSAGKIELADLHLEVRTDFATIALSSLMDAPIAESTFLLLSAVGRADNTGAQYDEKRSLQLDPGHPPIQIEPIEAAIRLRTSHPHLKVWVISDKSEVATRLPTSYADGWLTFDIGAQPPYNPSTMYYLIRL